MKFDQQVTFVYVSDLQRSHDFYAEKLGLEFVLDQGTCRIFRAAGDAFIGCCERPDKVNPEGVILTLVSSEIDEWHARLDDAGIETDGEPRYNEDYDIEHFYARDPDGYAVEIQRFCSKDWPDPVRSES